MTKREKKILMWKKAYREAIRNMNPTGFVEMPNNKFIAIFDRELNEQEREIAQALNLELKAQAFAYTYNLESNFKNFMFAFDANVLTLYSNVIVYDKKVNENYISGLRDLEFNFKTRLDIYETEYRG